MSKLYRDSHDSADINYSYTEWDFFLGLLGRDQIDKIDGELRAGRGESKAEVKNWSWIDNQNPLMEDEKESKWLLHMMFRKLEENLLLQWKQQPSEEAIDRPTGHEHPRKFQAQIASGNYRD
jgi:hypothetical protein